MSFNVQRGAGDKWKLIVSEEPGFVHALPVAPASLEPELNSGTWLIVAFSIWSIHDRHSVLGAINCAKRFGGRFQLGIRPYDSFEENARWWPIAEPLPASNLVCD